MFRASPMLLTFKTSPLQLMSRASPQLLISRISSLHQLYRRYLSLEYCPYPKVYLLYEYPYIKLGYYFDTSILLSLHSTLSGQFISPHLFIFVQIFLRQFVSHKLEQLIFSRQLLSPRLFGINVYFRGSF